MSPPRIDQPAPEFTAPATSDREVSLQALRGRPVVLYFYPKDDTPGCTREGQDLRDLYPRFQALDAEVLGVSRDSLGSHEKFRAKYALPFDLIADTDETLCQLYDVIRTRKLYGKDTRGIERATFLIDAQGVLRREWRKVSVDGHAAEVLGALEALPGQTPER